VRIALEGLDFSVLDQGRNVGKEGGVSVGETLQKESNEGGERGGGTSVRWGRKKKKKKNINAGKRTDLEKKSWGVLDEKK